jgi:NADPH-dependent 7-cyano-7-deazaguanine reductase QueF
MDESDLGTVTVSWKPGGETFELHSLRAYLDTWTEVSVSHESITERIDHDLTITPGITTVTVATTWDTASFDVQVQGGEGHALLREPVNTESE